MPDTFTPDEEAFYQKVKARLAQELPAPIKWWQDSDKLIKVIGAIGIAFSSIAASFAAFQSYFAKSQSVDNASKIATVQEHQAANTSKLEEVKTETKMIGAKINK